MSTGGAEAFFREGGDRQALEHYYQWLCTRIELSRDEKAWGSELRQVITMRHEWAKEERVLEKVAALEVEIAELRSVLGASQGREGDAPEPPSLEDVH
jgi:hypothetical protein